MVAGEPCPSPPLVTALFHSVHKLDPHYQHILDTPLQNDYCYCYQKFPDSVRLIINLNIFLYLLFFREMVKVLFHGQTKQDIR